MRFLCLLTVVSALFSPVGSNEQPQPRDATEAIIQAFDTHSIVMFGEVHENKQEYEFLRALVASPQFADKVEDIVVEYGNSLYQKAVDRYIAGEDVPIEEVQKAWRNTMALGPVSPVYPSLYEAVRNLNRQRLGKHQLRILLGDPYIDWDKMQSLEDVGPYVANRDQFYVEVVKEEVLKKHHRALLIEGWHHFRRTGTGLRYVEKELRATGATTFLILFGTNAVGGYDDLDNRFNAWKVPAIMLLKGTWVGDLPADPVMTGGTVLAGPNPLKLQDAGDALLYLGSRDALTTVHMARAELEGTPYGREMARRLEIFFGRPINVIPAATETPQFPRGSGSAPPLPPPPKSMHDPLPPRPPLR